MNITCDLYKGIVYIPTSYAIHEGFYCQDAPIQIVKAEETQNLLGAIRIAAERGNPPITKDEASQRWAAKEGAYLKATGARSWNKLDRERTGLWSLVERNGLYQIHVDCPMKPRGWHEDKSKRVVFPDGTSAEEAIIRPVEMIQERQREVAG